MPGHVDLKEFVPTDRRMTITEALPLMGVHSYASWQTWLNKGRIKLPLFKDGARWFVKWSDVKRIIDGEDRLLYTTAETREILSAKAKK